MAEGNNEQVGCLGFYIDYVFKKILKTLSVCVFYRQLLFLPAGRLAAAPPEL